jgi:hypothetical protein
MELGYWKCSEWGFPGRTEWKMNEKNGWGKRMERNGRR